MCGVVARSALLLLAVLVELAEIRPEVVDLLGILDAREGHAGAGYPLHRILDVLLERRLVPGDAGILVGVGIVEARIARRGTAIETVERRPELDLGAFAGVVARQAPLPKRGLAPGRILRQRETARRHNHQSCQNPSPHHVLLFPPNDAVATAGAPD